MLQKNNLVDWEGERLVPSNANLDTSVNHIIRYQFAKKNMYGKTLDAACGAGYGSYLLAENYENQVYGIDIEKSAIEWASTAYGDQDNLKFEEKDIYQTGYRDEEFDTVVSFETLEHLPELENYFKELNRITSSNGQIIFSVPDWETNNGAGNINEFHLNELTFESFCEYLNRYYSSSELYFQEIKKPTTKQKTISFFASFLPLKLKALIKNVLARSSNKTRFTGKNFNELEMAYGDLFHSYRVRDIQEYKNLRNNIDQSRYVFLAICQK